MRLPGQQDLVLGAGGLALGAVGDHDRAARPRGHRRQLARRREARASAAGEPGPRHLGDQRIAAARVSRTTGERAVPGEMVAQGRRAASIPGGQQPGQPGRPARAFARRTPAVGRVRAQFALHRADPDMTFRGPPRGRAGWRGRPGPAEQAGQHGRRHHGRGSALDQRHPPDVQVVARGQRVDERDRPGQIGEPVHRPPGAEPEPLPEQAGEQHRAAQVDRQRAQSDGHGPVRRAEGQHGRGPARRTNGSRIAVTTCRTSRATANSERVRCSSATANRGHRRGAEPIRVAAPSAITTLNSTSSTRPLPRETNHSPCEPEAATAALVVIVLPLLPGCPSADAPPGRRGAPSRRPASRSSGPRFRRARRVGWAGPGPSARPEPARPR